VLKEARHTNIYVIFDKDMSAMLAATGPEIVLCKAEFINLVSDNLGLVAEPFDAVI